MFGFLFGPTSATTGWGKVKVMLGAPIRVVEVAQKVEKVGGEVEEGLVKEHMRAVFKNLVANGIAERLASVPILPVQVAMLQVEAPLAETAQVGRVKNKESANLKVMPPRVYTEVQTKVVPNMHGIRAEVNLENLAAVGNKLWETFVLMKLTQEGKSVTEREAVKPEYTGPKWKRQFLAEHGEFFRSDQAGKYNVTQFDLGMVVNPFMVQAACNKLLPDRVGDDRPWALLNCSRISSPRIEPQVGDGYCYLDLIQDPDLVTRASADLRGKPTVKEVAEWLAIHEPATLQRPFRGTYNQVLKLHHVNAGGADVMVFKECESHAPGAIILNPSHRLGQESAVVRILVGQSANVAVPLDGLGVVGELASDWGSVKLQYIKLAAVTAEANISAVVGLSHFARGEVIDGDNDLYSCSLVQAMQCEAMTSLGTGSVTADETVGIVRPTPGMNPEVSKRARSPDSNRLWIHLALTNTASTVFSLELHFEVSGGSYSAVPLQLPGQ